MMMNIKLLQKYGRLYPVFFFLFFALELPNFPADVTVWWVQLMSRTAELLCVVAAETGLYYQSV